MVAAATGCVRTTRGRDARLPPHERGSSLRRVRAAAQSLGLKFREVVAPLGRKLDSVRGSPGVMRWGRPVAIGLSILFVAFAALRLYATATLTYEGLLGYDYGHYLDATRRWIDIGTPYLPSEVAAPFDYAPLTFLHPPTSLPFFAIFLPLPAILWWAIPLAIVAISVAAYRPAAWTWPVMAASLAFPGFAAVMVVGNTDMWAWAAFALAIRWGWPAALLVAVKPSLAVLGLVGITRRSTWIVGLLVVVVAMFFGDLWWQWGMVVINSPGNLDYSRQNLPWLIMPAIAWAGRASSQR